MTFQTVSETRYFRDWATLVALLDAMLSGLQSDKSYSSYLLGHSKPGETTMLHHESSPRAEIDATNAAFMAAFRRSASAGLAAVYTEDAQIFAPNFPVMRGKPTIQAFWQGVLDMGVAEVVLETVEFAAQGDTAWEVGQGVLKTKDSHIIDEVKYIVIWKRENGVWKWQHDIWNSSRPAQA
jgi:ketosteroid isomerase-like protein